MSKTGRHHLTQAVHGIIGEHMFRRLNWENKGVKIDEEFLSNLRFADDMFLYMHRNTTRTTTDDTRTIR